MPESQIIFNIHLFADDDDIILLIHPWISRLASSVIPCLLLCAVLFGTTQPWLYRIIFLKELNQAERLSEHKREDFIRAVYYVIVIVIAAPTQQPFCTSCKALHGTARHGKDDSREILKSL